MHPRPKITLLAHTGQPAFMIERLSYFALLVELGPVITWAFNGTVWRAWNMYSWSSKA